jgi:hypothetical protein
MIREHTGPVDGDGFDVAVKGWEAVGFRVPGEADPPDTYGNFRANQMCIGCHGDALEFQTFEDETVKPDIASIDPSAGCPGAVVSLIGTDFEVDPAQGITTGRKVQFRTGTSPNFNWVNVPLISWIDTEIVFQLPGWVFTPGNYKVRIYDDLKPSGFKTSSGNPTFTVKDCGSPQQMVRNSGPCDKANIELTSPTGSFGNAKDTISANGANDGVYRVIAVSAVQGEYIVLKDKPWDADSVMFKFLDFFEDDNGDYLQQVAINPGDPDEPRLKWCNTIEDGPWSVYIRYIFYSDDDSSGDYTEGDLVYQVESSNPLVYTLTDDMNIFKLKPKAAPSLTVIKIFGVNFGSVQTNAEVRIGTKSQYNNSPFTKGKVQNRIRLWSNTKIKFKLKVPATWDDTKKRYVWIVRPDPNPLYEQVSDKKYLDIQ